MPTSAASKHGSSARARSMPIKGAHRVHESGDVRPSLNKLAVAFANRLSEHERLLGAGNVPRRLGLELMQGGAYCLSRRRVGPERLQQCRTQLQVVGADQDRGASNLVMLDQLTEQLGDELKIRGDSALGSDGGCRIAQLECEFTMLGQPGPLGQELRKQALALRALQSLEINGGRALGGQNGGSGGRTEMIMAVAMQRVR